MDTKDNLLVVGTADRHIAIFNLSNPTTIYKSLQSPLKYQTRVVSCFTTGNGFAVGSVEGRCAIQYVEDKVNYSLSSTSNLLGLEFEFLISVSSRYADCHSARSDKCLLRQRNLIPPSTRNVLHCWIRWIVPLLGQGFETQIERVWTGGCRRNHLMHGLLGLRTDFRVCRLI